MLLVLIGLCALITVSEQEKRQFQCFAPSDPYSSVHCQDMYEQVYVKGIDLPCNEKWFGLSCCNFCSNKGETPIFDCQDDNSDCRSYRIWKDSKKSMRRYFLARYCFDTIFCKGSTSSTTNPPTTKPSTKSSFATTLTSSSKISTVASASNIKTTKKVPEDLDYEIADNKTELVASVVKHFHQIFIDNGISTRNVSTDVTNSSDVNLLSSDSTFN